jgi:excisionase family DNA binding protein
MSAIEPIEPLSVSISESCQRLGVGETTLRALLDNGRLPFSRVPGANPDSRGRVLIKVADLNALLDATRVDVSRSNARPVRTVPTCGHSRAAPARAKRKAVRS